MKRLADAWAVLMGNKAAWDINADPMVAYEYEYSPWGEDGPWGEGVAV